MTTDQHDEGPPDPRRDPAYQGARPGAFPAGSFAWGFAGGAIGATGSDAMSALLARNWWAVALRGVFGILFGLLAILLPGITLASLVLLFAVYMMVDGILTIIAGVRAARHHARWGALIVEGAVDLIAGAIAFFWPLITLIAFIIVMGAWAIVSGALELGAALRLHLTHGRWLMGLGGVVSLLWGLLLIVQPAVGAVVLAWWLGAYALIFGAALLALAFRLRRRHHDTPAPGAGYQPA